MADKDSAAESSSPEGSPRPGTAGPAPARGAQSRLKADLRVQVPSNQGKDKRDGEGQGFKRITPPEKLEDLFELESSALTDSGERSKVITGKRKATGAEVVVKIRYKNRFNGGEIVWRTVLTRFMNLKQHDHVLGVQEILEDDEAYYIVMERCHGGELFEFLLTETDVPEVECKRIMREILQAVGHLHSQGIVHRDIKPENILFTSVRSPTLGTGLGKINENGATSGGELMLKEPEEKSPKTVKLIDFDTIQEWCPKTPKSTRIVGTPGYIAPEAYLGSYSPASDLWSCGVIFYILMTGDMPFSEEIFGDDLEGSNLVGSDKVNRIYQRLANAEIDWECPPWPDFPLARDLCQRLLQPSLDCRSPSANDALKHAWLMS